MNRFITWLVSKTLIKDIIEDDIYCDENIFIRNVAIAFLPIRMLWYLPSFIIGMVKIHNKDLKK
jgi:hypothetical protein